MGSDVQFESLVQLRNTSKKKKYPRSKHLFMYIGLNLKYENFLTSPQEKFYYDKGKELFKLYSNSVEEKLEDLILKNGNIDGTRMQENWFPSVEADIFLSHSHKNEKQAIALSGYLYDKMGIKTFVDSCIWGYSADLLKDLDKTFCKRDDGYFDYNKRNFTTSNVHMMLSTALTKMMDKAECLLFFNTPESISFEDGVKSSTLSPWIYSEIETSKLIRKKSLKEYRELKRSIRMLSEDVKAATESFQYSVELTHLTLITQKHIRRWISSYNNDKYPLDLLYSHIESESKII